MPRFAALVALCALLCGFAPPAPTDRANARQAYSGFLAHFWFGAPATGHFGIINGNALDKAAARPARETPAQAGWLWQYAQAWNVAYVYWRTAPSGDPLRADAQVRLAAEWAWVKATWPSIGVASCGAVAGTAAQAMDDATWAASGLIQLYDATHDGVALQDAANLLACGYARWRTPATGGGLLYCDASDASGCPSPLSTYKASFNGQFGLAMMECAERGCSASGLTTDAMRDAGKALVDWGNVALLRSGKTCTQADSLYWMDVHEDARAVSPGENGCAQAAVIAPARSITQLSNNLSFAAANAKLQTKGASYRALAQATAESILKLEVDPNGVLINDRDQRTALYGLYPFFSQALPLLSPAQQSAWRAALTATARSIAKQGGSGLYRPDWDPAWNAGWAAFSPDQIEIGAQQAVAVILAGAAQF